MSCVVTTAVWPVLGARRAPARSWILGVYGCATVTVVFAGLSCWLLIAARDGAGDLGLVERLTSAVQSLFPFVVALALRQTARDAGNQRHAVTSVSRQWQALTPGRPKDSPQWPDRIASMGKPGADIRQSRRLASSWPPGNNARRRAVDWFEERGDGRAFVPTGGTGPARDTAQWPGGRRCRGDRGRCAGSEHRAALRDGWPVGCGGGTPHSRVAGLRPGGGPVQVGPGGRATYPAGPAQHRQGDHLRRLGRDAPAGSLPREFPDRPDRPASPVPAPGTGTVTTLGRRRPRGNPGAARRPAQLLPAGWRRLRPVVPGGHLYRRAGQPHPGLPGGLPAARGRGNRKRAGHRDIGNGRPGGRCRDQPPAGRRARGRGRGRRLGTPRGRRWPGRGCRSLWSATSC